jgi:hypothetical protein
MPEPLDQLATHRSGTQSGSAITPQPPVPGALDDEMRATQGLALLVAEAEATWRARAAAAGVADDAAHPGWRTFEDAFPTFYEFTNRPR